MADLEKRPTSRAGRRQYDFQRKIDQMWETALTLGPEGLRMSAKGDPARERLLAALRQPNEINWQALQRAAEAEAEARHLRLTLATALPLIRDRKSAEALANQAARDRKDPHRAVRRWPKHPAA